MKQSEYVKHSGLSKGHVSALVKAGMPLSSPEEADAWRAGGRGKKPVSSVPSEVRSGTGGAEDVEEAFERARAITRKAFDLANAALDAGSPAAGRLLGYHSQALKNLLVIQGQVLEALERSRRFVSGDWVKRVMNEHDGAVVALAKAMPKSLAARIAPHDPEHAEAELERWVQDVFLKTLYETTPWREGSK